jgi:hypothetical protein
MRKDGFERPVRFSTTALSSLCVNVRICSSSREANVALLEVTDCIAKEPDTYRRSLLDLASRSLRRTARAALWTLIGIHILCTLEAEAVQPSEYQLKAVFLFNFLQFVEWPPSAFESPEQALTVCVLGPDPFGRELDTVVAGEQIGGRPIEVVRLKQIGEASSCHLLFMTLRSQQQLRKTLAQLKGQPVLTVSDTAPFAHLGGMIEFVTQDDRIRLRINVRAAGEAQLHLSSKLLRRSEIVSGNA